MDKFLISGLRKDYGNLISHVYDCDLICRYKYIMKTLKTTIKRTPDTIKYLINGVN